MKSFCGVQGRFFQKEPLAVGDKNKIKEDIFIFFLEKRKD
jgi:hypothetical protein